MRSVTEILREDHDKAKQTLNKILETSPDAKETRTSLFSEIKHELEVHMEFEEQVLYPEALEATGMSEEVRDDFQEHQEAKEMLGRLSSMVVTSEGWIETISELKEALDHHIQDEQDKLFPAVEDQMDEERLEEMGREYLEKKGDGRVTQVA